MQKTFNIKNIVQENPLILFSSYTDAQYKWLIEIRKDILKMLKKETYSTKMHGLVWLWFLGAYEMLRTMDDEKAKDCFSKVIKTDLTKLKIKFAEIRMCFAKQEYRRNSDDYIHNEISAYGYGNGDISFKIKDKIYSFNSMSKELIEFINKIQPIDIKNKIL